MEYIDEYRNPDLVRHLAAQIRMASRRPIRLMEVCGTHTVTVFRNGIREILPEHITLVSGPGCPICVTPVDGIDRAIALTQAHDLTIATFGDLMRVPGSETSLLRQRGEGADIRVVYSTYDALHLAEKDEHRDVVFLGVGFETTAPTVGAVIQRAQASRISNFTVLSMHKVIPPSLEALLQSPEVGIDGFICPGHVSTIIGTEPYKVIAENYHVPCVIAGFEPVDILQSIGLLVRQIEREEAKVEVQYKRAVTVEGNPRAKAVLDEVFEPCDSAWRGFGVLPRSGLKIAPSWGEFDAEGRFAINPVKAAEPKGCLCGRILQGLSKPPDCPLFGQSCTPDHPVGACMVSSEGTCAAYHRYST